MSKGKDQPDELNVIRVLLELDLHDGLDGRAGALRIHDGRVTLDQPGRFELADAARAGGRREPHLFGEVRDADPPIALQDVEDSSIGLVQLHNWRI